MLISVLVAGLARQRSRAETSADEVRQQLASIVTSSEDAILSFTVDGVVTSWNRGAQSLYGYSAREIIGRPLAVLVPTDRMGELERNLERLNRDERVGSYETERVHKSGARLRVLLSVSPIHNEKGELVGASAIARDISQQKRTEEALRRNERLATAGRLTAAIAHEVSQPLAGILTNAGTCRRMLAVDPPDVEGARETTRRTIRDAERASEVIKRLRALFCKKGASSESLDLNEVTREVVALSLSELERNKVSVRTELASELPRLQGDLQL